MLRNQLWYYCVLSVFACCPTATLQRVCYWIHFPSHPQPPLRCVPALQRRPAACIGSCMRPPTVRKVQRSAVSGAAAAALRRRRHMSVVPWWREGGGRGARRAQEDGAICAPVWCTLRNYSIDRDAAGRRQAGRTIGRLTLARQFG